MNGTAATFAEKKENSAACSSSVCDRSHADLMQAHDASMFGAKSSVHCMHKTANETNSLEDYYEDLLEEDETEEGERHDDKFSYAQGSAPRRRRGKGAKGSAQFRMERIKRK